MLAITHGADTWVEVSHLSLEGNRFNQTSPASHGIVVESPETLARYHDVLHGLYVRNFRGNGLRFVKGAPHRISDSTFHDNGGAQIHHGPSALDNYVLNTVVGTDATEPGSTGWWCQGSNNVWIGGAAARCEIGMRVDGLRNALTGGTSIDSNARQGLVIRGNETRVTSAIFRNNSVSGPGRFDDVVIDGSTGGGRRNLLSGCIVDGSSLATEPGIAQARYGVIEVGGAADTVVSGCILTGHSRGGIRFFGAGDDDPGR